jgi:acyl-CoA synthetase (AMP-forming)/AMP-acid ligase II
MSENPSLNGPNSQHTTGEPYNIAQSLEEMATRAPFRRAIVFPSGRDRAGRAKFIQFSFQQLNQLVDRYAHGLSQYGITRGERTLMMVRPGVELIAVTFALFKVGAVPVLIDPGMGRKPFLQCVAETEPVSFIGIPLAHVLRTLFPSAFKTIKRPVTVGRRWFWGGATLDNVISTDSSPFPMTATTTEDEAAVTFTSGSTGIPKGVVYLHGMFKAQIEFLRNEIGIAEGEVDMPGLPIFALFNPALGVTTIIPDMDARKPAALNPAYWVESIQTHGVTTSFGSPTIWRVVEQYCQANDITLPSLKRVLMAGAPVPPWLIERYQEKILPNGQVLTPFGATEALPISNISGNEILANTAHLTEQGWGVCVGRPLSGLSVKVIPISDDPIPQWDESLPIPAGEVGEIVVKGPVVTRLYLHRPEQTALAKIQDHDGIWHRMGDLGYFDSVGRLWMCGRKSHRVETTEEMLLPVPVEAIFNAHPKVHRSALIGIGPPGQQHPVLVVEPGTGQEPTGKEKEQLVTELLEMGQAHKHTQAVRDIMFHSSFPVDVRHNVKIQREKLADWAAKQKR